MVRAPEARLLRGVPSVEARKQGVGPVRTAARLMVRVPEVPRTITAGDAVGPPVARRLVPPTPRPALVLLALDVP